MNSLTNSEQSSKKFNTIEYAEKSIFNRHIFKPIVDLHTPKPEEELYRSHFVHHNSIIDYFNLTKNSEGNNTLAGYDDQISIDKIVIDIDDSNLSQAHENTKKLIQKLESDYQLPKSSVEVNFSGSKGFHIRLDSSLFGGFEPSIDLNDTAKRIAETLSDGIVKIDSSIYDKTRLVRVVNSFNKKSSLYAIPLSDNELFRLSIDEIKALAHSPRIITNAAGKHLTENEALSDLKIIRQSPAIYQLPADNNIFQQKTSGERHGALATMVGKMINAKFNDDQILQIAEVWDQGNNPPMGSQRLQKETTDLIKRYGDIKGRFWSVKRGKKGLDPNVNLTEYINYLKESGFHKISLGSDYEFIRVDNNIAEISSSQKIKDFVLRELKENTADKMIRETMNELLLDRVAKYFNEKLLETVDTIEMNMKADTINESYLFYKNGVVKVTKDEEIDISEYTELKSPIWESQIKQRQYDPIKVKYSRSEFEQFLWKVTGEDENRMLSLCSAIGYMLHRYKNKSVTKAIILMDEKVSETPEGRTGKSLLGKAISSIRDSVRVDGKNFQFREQFTFQQITPSTEILEFNDVKKEFDFERLFSVLTDDMTVEYKNKSPFILPFEKSPKIMVSTNYTIKGRGDSYNDRIFNVELSDYYNSKRKPADEFGHLFFDQWDEIEWNRFDNFMVECLQLYLDNNLIENKKINVDQKKLLNETSSEFLDFMRQSFVKSNEYDKDDLYKRFKGYLGYEDDIFGKCPVKKNTFTKYLKTYAAYEGYLYIERSSNGIQYCRLG